MSLKIIYPFLLVAFLSVINNILAAETGVVTGKVTAVTTNCNTVNPYSEETCDGLTNIYVEGLPNACGTGAPRVAIGVGHPLYQTVVSLALTALTTQLTANLSYVETCTVRGNSWDFSYMYLNAN